MIRILFACALAFAVSGCGTLGTIAYCVAVDNLPNHKCQ